ncbi:DUF2017 family protein [Lysinibacter sp. HNR]|uniref:DUF2017 family protein n=1 Tax=Lysinibacter sp. HNR TaxID=3031408 RepID=UPI0024356A74|nr:DUF2017 family protein [Lysinibacter sp. HNR]WGD38447.1 DUF2017 family protein [Lysinibacter sp. HNR]
MKISRINSEGITTLHIHKDEADLVDTLVTQLLSLYREYSPRRETSDPLLEGLSIGGASTKPTDPALARLLPDAYENEQESSEFRQVTEQGIVDRKVFEAESILVQLGTARFDEEYFTDPADPIDSQFTHDDLPAVKGMDNERMLAIQLDADSLLTWVKTLTAMRLALAARLGIEAEKDLNKKPFDDMEANTRAVYDWLAEFTEALLHAQYR